MKRLTITLISKAATGAAALMLLAQAQAQFIFSDNFDAGASPLWRNEVGSWYVTGGAYRPAYPANAPAAVSSLPYDLANFSVDFDVKGTTDGGIFLRSSRAPGKSLGIKGIEFNLQTINGSKVYWHIVTDGSQWGTPQNLASATFGSNPHVRIEVSGNTYAAFLNGSATPISTLTTSLFSHGEVALYDYSYYSSVQTYDNFVLQTIPEPGTSLLLVPGLGLLFSLRRARRLAR